MLRSLIISALCMLSPMLSTACGWASQNRMFPLGICSDGIVVVETHLYRTEVVTDGSYEECDLAWRGDAWLKVYTLDHKVVSSALMDSVNVMENGYVALLQRMVDAGLGLARSMSGFIEAKPVKVGFYGYRRSTPVASVKCDHGQMYLRVAGRMEQVCFPADTTDISYNIREFYDELRNESDLDPEDDRMPVFTPSLVCGRLKINSVRQFTIGGRKLTVVHLGLGDDIGHLPHRAFACEVDNFNDISRSVYDEPAKHHGRGFDFFIVR